MLLAHHTIAADSDPSSATHDVQSTPALESPREQNPRVPHRVRPSRSERVRQAIRSALAGVALAALTVGPAFAEAPSAAPASYTVQSGDSLNRIADQLGVRAGDLALWNSISDMDIIRVGQVLRVGDADVGRAQPATRSSRSSAPTSFTMPMPGVITTYFGEAGSLWRLGYHPGLDIGAPVGTAIRAAGEGIVVEAEESGWNSGYGHYVKVDHGGGVHTLYAHLSTVAVSVGDEVFAGTLLGRVGMTGVTTGPHLHWEVRVNGVKRDPLSWVR